MFDRGPNDLRTLSGHSVPDPTLSDDHVASVPPLLRLGPMFMTLTEPEHGIHQLGEDNYDNHENLHDFRL